MNKPLGLLFFATESIGRRNNLKFQVIFAIGRHIRAGQLLDDFRQIVLTMRPHGGSKSILEDILPMSSIEERVKKIVVEQLGVNEGEVKPDASFVDDLGADSLDTVELVMALEEEFDCEIPDEQAEKITTVKQAIDYINSHQS